MSHYNEVPRKFEGGVKPETYKQAHTHRLGGNWRQEGAIW